MKIIAKKLIDARLYRNSELFAWLFALPLDNTSTCGRGLGRGQAALVEATTLVPPAPSA
jgi:hypothetical protein